VKEKKKEKRIITRKQGVSAVQPSPSREGKKKKKQDGKKNPFFFYKRHSPSPINQTIPLLYPP
jgi:hypothetical protein